MIFIKKFSNFVKKELLISLYLLGLFCQAGSALFAVDFYWENPLSIASSDAIFPSTLNTESKSLVFWQNVDSQKKEIYISCRTYTSLSEYSDNHNFAGPFTYSGDEVPYIYTAAVLKSGLTAVAVLSGKNSISVFTSSDFGLTWKSSRIRTSGLMVAPRIFAARNDKKEVFKMFISAGQENSFMLYESESSDGVLWSNFEPFKPAENLRNPFLPYLSTIENRNLVVFQSQLINPSTSRISYQLYMAVQSPDGRSWGEAILLTDMHSLSLRDTNEFHDYQNQRPFLYAFQDHSYLAWERSLKNQTSIWVAEIDKNGLVPLTSEAVSASANASCGVLFEYDNKLSLSWFDNRRGRDGVYMAQRSGSYWEENTLCENQNANEFVYPLIISDSAAKEEKVLTYVWQQTSEKA